jgi:hypothetical protein
MRTTQDGNHNEAWTQTGDKNSITSQLGNRNKRGLHKQVMETKL